LLAFQNVSYDLRCEADLFIYGFLVPGLLPGLREPRWGEIGSRVRGTCRHYNPDRGFGFLRYLMSLDNLTESDTAGSRSPFRDAFFHFSNMPHGLDRGLLPNRDMIFEFTLVPSTAEQGKMAASEITMVYDYGAGRWTPPLNDREPRPAMVTAQQRSPALIEAFHPPDIEDLEEPDA
jgi:cold shock CspA family protein